MRAIPSRSTVSWECHVQRKGMFEPRTVCLMHSHQTEGVLKNKWLIQCVGPWIVSCMCRTTHTPSQAPPDDAQAQQYPMEQREGLITSFNHRKKERKTNNCDGLPSQAGADPKGFESRTEWRAERSRTRQRQTLNMLHRFCIQWEHVRRRPDV